MVFQSYALYPHMTVYDNMAFGLKLGDGEQGRDRQARPRGGRHPAAHAPISTACPRQLSGGQRQRVAIGRAIVRDPKVFLFDEPLSNLDAALRVATRIEIAKLHERMPDTTMIYVTHDQVEAMTLADRIVVLNAGNIEQVGAPLELYQHPGQPVRRRLHRLAGDEHGAVRDRGERRRRRVVKPEIGGTAIVAAEIPADAVGKKGTFGVRPEDLVAHQGRQRDLHAASSTSSRSSAR